MERPNFAAMSARELADAIAEGARNLSLAASYLKDKPGCRRIGGSTETELARIATRIGAASFAA